MFKLELLDVIKPSLKNGSVVLQSLRNHGGSLDSFSLTHQMCSSPMLSAGCISEGALFLLALVGFPKPASLLETKKHSNLDPINGLKLK